MGKHYTLSACIEFITPINHWQKKMKVNFLMNQAVSLEKCVDLSIKRGVCSAMVMEWSKRELNGEKQSLAHYSNAYRFSSLQRAMAERHCSRNQFCLVFKSDHFEYIPWGSMHYTRIIEKMAPVTSGVFIIDIFFTPTLGHCMGLSIANGKYKLFDPNFGECEEINKKDHRQALFYIVKYFHSIYTSQKTQQMRIIKLQRK